MSEADVIDAQIEKKEEKSTNEEQEAPKEDELALVKVKCDELETTLINREQEREELLNTIAMLTNQNEVHRKDFEEERKDRERAHYELEQLKREKISLQDKITQSLQAEMLQKDKQFDSLRKKLATVEANCAKLWELKEEYEDKIKTLQDDNYHLNRKCDSYKYDLKCSEAHLKECQDKLRDCYDEIQQLRQIVAKATPEMNYTLQDQLDIAKMMNESLMKDKEKSVMIIEKLQNDVKMLQRQSHHRHEFNGHNNAPLRNSDCIYDRPTSSTYASRERHQDQDCLNNQLTGHSQVPKIRNNSDPHDLYSRRPSCETRPRDYHCDRNVKYNTSGSDESQNRCCSPPLHQPPAHACAADSHGIYSTRNRGYMEVQQYESSDGSRGLTAQHSTLSRNDETSDRFDAKFTKALEYISVELGDLSEEERTSLKTMVDMSKYFQEEDLDHDIKSMCEKMKELRCDQQEAIKTDIKQGYDPNLVCPNCTRQFRHGEIQKFRKHVEHCA